MQNHKNIYTLNRENPDAIIYLDSDGKIIRLTREDFSSEEEFRHWKAVSDQQYKLEEHEANAYRIRTVMFLSISCLSYNKGSNWLAIFSLGYHVREKDCQPSSCCSIRFKQVEPMCSCHQID